MAKPSFTRREFLKMATVAGGGLVAASCVPAAPATPAAPAGTAPAAPAAPATAPAASGGGNKVTVNVLSQPRREWQEGLEKWLPEFKTKEPNIDVVVHYFAENERRSKSRLDASTGAGQYQVYYIDEANVAEFATNKWLVPINDFYPKEADFAGLSEPLVKVLGPGGINYGAPMSFEGEIMFWRKDLFDADKVAAPKTLDEYLEAVKHFHKPPEMYGTATRGLRGSGMNVWRFSPYLKMFGGSYLDDAGKPAFNSPEAIKAVEYYLELIKHCAGPTMSWSDAMDSFASGKVAIVDFANLKMDYLMDKKTSTIMDKMGFARSPDGPKGSISNTSVHGLGISAAGAATDEVRAAAGKFIGWWTSAEMEIRKVKAGMGLTNGRTATFASPEFSVAYPPEFAKAQVEMMKTQQMCILQIPQWPEIGDYLGIKLEEMFTQAYSGGKPDIKTSLDDAVKYATDVLAKAKQS